MSGERYEAPVYRGEDLIDVLEVGGDDGSLPPLEMGPATAREELEALAHDNYGANVHIGAVRLKGATA